MRSDLKFGQKLGMENENKKRAQTRLTLEEMAEHKGSRNTISIIQSQLGDDEKFGKVKIQDVVL
jgi:hypothetical protein